jgi:(R,R)-butanediol dehydrogenase/meso-butanediol dehydrogenase/diacetyl reductase
MPTAAVYYGEKDIRIEDRSAADVGPGDVAIEVRACGICGSDVHEYEAGPIVVPDDEPNHMTDETLPLVLGHECSGVVRETGDAVETVSVGDRVSVNPVMVCGDCRYCDRGLYNLCHRGGSIGLTAGVDGGFAKRCVVPAELAIPIPDGVALEHGALAEPLSVGLHAVRRAGVQPGDTVSVFGTGPIGLGIVGAARVAGARVIIASEPSDFRRNRAGTVGADHCLDPTDTDPVERIGTLTDGGADITFEVAGVEPSIKQAIRGTDRRGTVTVVSLFETEVPIQPNELVLGERSLVGSRAYSTGPLADEDWGMTMQNLATGAIDPANFITDRISLETIVDDGFERLVDPANEQIKILVEP